MLTIVIIVLLVLLLTRAGFGFRRRGGVYPPRPATIPPVRPGAPQPDAPGRTTELGTGRRPINRRWSRSCRPVSTVALGSRDEQSLIGCPVLSSSSNSGVLGGRKPGPAVDWYACPFKIQSIVAQRIIEAGLTSSHSAHRTSRAPRPSSRSAWRWWSPGLQATSWAPAPATSRQPDPR